MCFLLLFISTAIAFATGSTGGTAITSLDSWGEKLIKIVSSKGIQSIAMLALMVECGGVIYAGRQGESGILKRFLPWIAGTVGLLGASGITEYFWTTPGT